jgi:hypothetical protein
MIESIQPLLPPNQSAIPGTVVPPSVTDPYAPVDEVGPYDPGMGWTCGGSCPPSWRGRVEVLDFTRNRASDNFSNGFRFDNIFDYQQAGRFTLDRRYDCTHGWELVYAGPFNFHEQAVATGAGNLNSALAAGRGINLSAFFGADLQEQRYDSRLQSAEFVYKSWGWNVIAVSYGGRYLNLNEKLAYTSVAAGDIGALRIGTDNEIVLGQIGVDMFLPLGRWSFDTTWKGAIGANVASSDTFLSNAGTIEINRSLQRTEFAALIEGGAFARYFITPRLTARIGYEFWWLHGVALAPRQIGSAITRNTGSHLEGTTEILFYGGSAGVEYVW